MLFTLFDPIKNGIVMQRMAQAMMILICILFNYPNVEMRGELKAETRLASSIKFLAPLPRPALLIGSKFLRRSLIRLHRGSLVRILNVCTADQYQ